MKALPRAVWQRAPKLMELRAPKLRQPVASFLTTCRFSSRARGASCSSLALTRKASRPPRWSTDFNAWAQMRSRTERPRVSEMSVTLHKFGKNRRLLLRFEWLTLCPVWAILPVKSHRRDIGKPSPSLGSCLQRSRSAAPVSLRKRYGPIVEELIGRQAGLRRLIGAPLRQTFWSKLYRDASAALKHLCRPVWHLLPAPSWRAWSAAAGSAVLATGLMGSPAFCQGKLEAHYVATIAGLPIGRGTWSIGIGEAQYSAAASGQTIGLMKMVSNGNGSVTVDGTIDGGGRLLPATYSARVNVDQGVETVQMALNAGTVAEVTAQPPYPPTPDRLPVLDAHRRGVLDPMTAGLMVVSGEGETLTPQACQRTLAIFDGRQRFDLALSFRRMDQVKAEQGYQGAVVVCRVLYQPVAGHRPGRAAIKYLMATREMEMWLAPIAGTRILVPFRISVPTFIGTAVLQATQFIVSAAATPRATAVIPKTQ
jgi:hypothetical protein